VDRSISSPDDEWSLRLTALSAAAGWDAVAIVADQPAMVRTHNVSRRVAFDPQLTTAIAESAAGGSAMLASARIQLSDGRVADGALVAPLRAVRGVRGSLIALRVGRGFGASEGPLAIGASEIASLEVFRSASATRDAFAAKQAFALYELARLALFTEGAAHAVQAIVEVLAGSLEHDIVQLWSLRAGGSLALRAAHPRDGLVLEIARPRDHAALQRALSGEVVRAHDPSLHTWVSRTTRDLIVAPLGTSERPVGVLVLGRWRRVYTTDDQEFAAVCARFVGRGLELAAKHGVSDRSELAAEPEVTVG